jgi:hypothetical protein
MSYSEWHSSVCHGAILELKMNVVMSNVVMMTVVPNVINLSVIILSVVAPFENVNAFELATHPSIKKVFFA